MSLLQKIKRAMRAAKNTGKALLVIHGKQVFKVGPYSCVKL